MNQIKIGAALSYFNILLTTVIGLVLTPFMIRTLGDSEYGLYTLVGSLVVYLTVMDLGLNNTVVRFVSKYRAEQDIAGERKFLGTTLLIYAAISTVLLFLGMVIYFNLDNIFSRSLTQTQLSDAKLMFLILVFNLAIKLPGGTFEAICNAYEFFVFPRLLRIIKYLLRAIVIVVVLTMGGKAISLVVIDTVFNVVSIVATILFVVTKMTVKFDFNEIRMSLIKKIFGYSVWIFLLGLSSHFLWSAGQILLGVETNTTTVAVYAVGIMLGGYYGAFSTAVTSLFLPRASRMTIHNSKEEILEMMIKVGRLTFMILMFVLTGFLLVGKEFVFLWVGTSYEKSWVIALFVMAVLTIPLVQNFSNSLIEAYNKVHHKVKIFLVCFSFGISLGYYLIPSLQEVGMAVGISSGWILAQICMNIYYHKHLNLNMIVFFNKMLTKTFFPIAFIYLFSSILQNFLPMSATFFVIKICTYSLIYWSVIYLFSMNDYEKQLVRIKFKPTRSNRIG